MKMIKVTSKRKDCEAFQFNFTEAIQMVEDKFGLKDGICNIKINGVVFQIGVNNGDIEVYYIHKILNNDWVVITEDSGIQTYTPKQFRDNYNVIYDDEIIKTCLLTEDENNNGITCHNIDCTYCDMIRIEKQNNEQLDMVINRLNKANIEKGNFCSLHNNSPEEIKRFEDSIEIDFMRKKRLFEIKHKFFAIVTTAMDSINIDTVDDNEIVMIKYIPGLKSILLNAKVITTDEWIDLAF